VEILNRAVHTGDVFGRPSKIVMSLASLMAPVQLVTGGHAVAAAEARIESVMRAIS